MGGCFESLGKDDLRVVVVGASGGIGRALTRRLADCSGVARIDALSRSGNVPEGDRIAPGQIDIADEASIARAVERLAEDGPCDAVLVATGILHGDDFGPEKDWRALEAETLQHLFRVNAIGPALFLGRLFESWPRDERRRIAGILSARVGSISDNRAGGWYGYRASKAALNQFLKTLAIEAARRRPGTIIAGLQPGTVRTPLSDPFRSGPTERQAIDPDRSAVALLEVLDGLGKDDSGGLFDWEGDRFEP